MTEIREFQHGRLAAGLVEVAMTTDYMWQESYLAALLETDCKKMRERLQAAEDEIRERQCR